LEKDEKLLTFGGGGNLDLYVLDCVKMCFGSLDFDVLVCVDMYFGRLFHTFGETCCFVQYNRNCMKYTLKLGAANTSETAHIFQITRCFARQVSSLKKRQDIFILTCAV
jgi:hypothetical protein